VRTRARHAAVNAPETSSKIDGRYSSSALIDRLMTVGPEMTSRRACAKKRNGASVNSWTRSAYARYWSDAGAPPAFIHARLGLVAVNTRTQRSSKYLALLNNIVVVVIAVL